ncbi:DUF952 domain-containing protein [Sphingomonas sp. CBMAI 2297]|uniref:DUF952 domain-containing protein n=1 Tax=Sphingomonas sp. CBMAI 2297 TaxID=2991720 RepID=UPI0024538ABF|nr:DUF952 domain-containing protein [Sphingomonas sp. CBMAI 2297]MDH4743799.1 DUF952 domain-containing protein [Sphingomonas sp. CBMAI 2297]
MPDTIAYKILTADQMHVLEHEGVFAGAPIDLADGYVHLSTAAQVAETLDKHFAGQAGLWLVAVDLEAMGDAVRWEPSRGGQLFPHLYAPLPLVAVTAYSEVHYEPDGTLRLPVAG